MARVIAGIGAISSGKTTVLLEIAKRCGYAYVCPDRIREEISGDEMDHTQNAQAWGIAYEQMHEALNKGETVIFDATQYKKIDRRTLIQEVQKHKGVELIGIYFSVPYVELIARNKKRARPRPEHAIRRMVDFLERDPPNPEEGFDAVILPSELHTYVCAQ